MSTGVSHGASTLDNARAWSAAANDTHQWYVSLADLFDVLCVLGERCGRNKSIFGNNGKTPNRLIIDCVEEQNLYGVVVQGRADVHGQVG